MNIAPQFPCGAPLASTNSATFSVHLARLASHEAAAWAHRVVTKKAPTSTDMNSSIVSLKTTFAVLVLNAAIYSPHASSISIPNGSFESPSTLPIGVSTAIDSWQKAAQPAYFNPATFGFTWDQTAGIFYDTNPYANHDGTQCAYLLSFPQVSLFQDSTSGLNATYGVGQSYTFTLGVFGKFSTLNNSLQLSLYYRDAGNNPVTIGTPTSIAYDPSIFPANGPFNLVDYSVTIPTVQAGDAWAGKNIGIMIQVGNAEFSAGHWDIDNARLTTVPEPALASLLALGACAFVFRRRS